MRMNLRAKMKWSIEVWHFEVFFIFLGFYFIFSMKLITADILSKLTIETLKIFGVFLIGLIDCVHRHVVASTARRHKPSTSTLSACLSFSCCFSWFTPITRRDKNTIVLWAVWLACQKDISSSNSKWSQLVDHFSLLANPITSFFR